MWRSARRNLRTFTSTIGEPKKVILENQTVQKTNWFFNQLEALDGNHSLPPPTTLRYWSSASWEKVVNSAAFWNGLRGQKLKKLWEVVYQIESHILNYFLAVQKIHFFVLIWFKFLFSSFTLYDLCFFFLDKFYMIYV